MNRTCLDFDGLAFLVRTLAICLSRIIFSSLFFLGLLCCLRCLGKLNCLIFGRLRLFCLFSSSLFFLGLLCCLRRLGKVNRLIFDRLRLFCLFSSSLFFLRLLCCLRCLGKLNRLIFGRLCKIYRSHTAFRRLNSFIRRLLTCLLRLDAEHFFQCSIAVSCFFNSRRCSPGRFLSLACIAVIHCAKSVRCRHISLWNAYLTFSAVESFAESVRREHSFKADRCAFIVVFSVDFTETCSSIGKFCGLVFC